MQQPGRSKLWHRALCQRRTRLQIGEARAAAAGYLAPICTIVLFPINLVGGINATPSAIRSRSPGPSLSVEHPFSLQSDRTKWTGDALDSGLLTILRYWRSALGYGRVDPFTQSSDSAAIPR